MHIRHRSEKYINGECVSKGTDKAEVYQICSMSASMVSFLVRLHISAKGINSPKSLFPRGTSDERFVFIYWYGYWYILTTQTLSAQCSNSQIINFCIWFLHPKGWWGQYCGKVWHHVPLKVNAVRPLYLVPQPLRDHKRIRWDNKDPLLTPPHHIPSRSMCSLKILPLLTPFGHFIDTYNLYHPIMSWYMCQMLIKCS